MTSEVLLVFIAACALLALTPGPTMALLLANTTTYGFRAGIMTLTGASLGLAILVMIATLGMNSIMVFMAEWFDWVRWIGAVYLIWIGTNTLISAFRSKPGVPVPDKRGSHFFRQGLFIALSNPKVLLFLGAFFPQFVSRNADITYQLVMLAMTFIIVMCSIDTGYVIVASRVSAFFTGTRRRFSNGMSGGLLILGGLWLASARKS